MPDLTRMNVVKPLLSNYPPDVQPTQVDPLGSAGGMSGAQFWRITTSRGTLVLRRWPKEHPSPDRLQFIHAVLTHAAKRGITFVPLPIRTTTGESFIQHAGHLWELAPWMPGTADYERSPSTEKLRPAMSALAQFHVAVADFSVGRQAEPTPANHSTAVPRHLTRLHQLAAGGINELSRAISNSTWPDLAPLAHQFVAALPIAMPRAISQLEPLANVRLPLQPCLRDIWHDHVLFTGDEVTGIIDLGAVDIDTPATDIARLLGSLAQGTVPFSRDDVTAATLGFDRKHHEAAKRGLSPLALDEAQTWREGLAAYSAVRPLSPDETRAVHAFDTCGSILAGCNWIRWIYIDGRQFDNHEQVVERFRRILARCAFPQQPRSGEIT